MKSLEPEIACHEKKGCKGRLYSTFDEECRACVGEEPLPPNAWEIFNRKD